MSLFKSELKRAFASKWFVIAVLIQLGIVVIHIILEVIPAAEGIPALIDYHNVNSLAVECIPGVFSEWIAMNTNAAKEILFVTLPIVSAIPYGATLYIDEKSRYINNIATRIDKKAYYISKMAVMFLSGGIIAAIPLVLSLLVNMSVLPIENPQSCTAAYLLCEQNVFGDLFFSHPFFYVFLYILWVFLLSGLLTSVCFTATYIMENRFIIMLAPYILYFVTYVMGNMFGKGIAYMWVYIQMNKMEITEAVQIIVQLALLIGINLLMLYFKCSKKNDVI